MIRRNKIPFNVIRENHCKFEKYDIMPYLIEVYKVERKKQKFENREDIKKFIIHEARYEWWGRCEYEIMIYDWPCEKYCEKWDVFDQIMMNIDIVVDIFMKNINFKVD